jgi:hypothetical protein
MTFSESNLWIRCILYLRIITINLQVQLYIIIADQNQKKTSMNDKAHLLGYTQKCVTVKKILIRNTHNMNRNVELRLGSGTNITYIYM